MDYMYRELEISRRLITYNQVGLNADIKHAIYSRIDKLF